MKKVKLESWVTTLLLILTGHLINDSTDDKEKFSEDSLSYIVLYVGLEILCYGLNNFVAVYNPNHIKAIKAATV